MNRGAISMNEKERRRLEVLSRVSRDEILLVEAARMMRVSYRQAKRIYRRFREEGDAGLVHRQRGQRSNRSTPAEVQERILARYRERYAGFGPTLAAEKLTEEGLRIDHETLRRWLLRSGDWQKQKPKKAQRQRRQRRPHFGELVQLDGSEHAWFGEEHSPCVLMNMIDDATNTTFSLLAENESTESAFAVLQGWIARYGVPQALYTDRHSVYYPMSGGLTQFGRACQELGIEIIYARSPQAKGRVERWNGIYQDRLVKELQLRCTTDRERANPWLQNEFVQDLNAKFSLSPRSATNFHQLAPTQEALIRVFSHLERRKVGKDWTLRWKNRIFQLSPEAEGVSPGQLVEVREDSRKRVSIYLGSKKLPGRELGLEKRAVREVVCPVSPESPTAKEPQPKTSSEKEPSPGKKQARYLEMKSLEKEGLSKRSIAQRMNVSRCTVIKYLNQGVPTYKRSKGPKRLLEPFEDQIQAWLLALPELSSREILDRLKARGYRGSYSTCKTYVRGVKLAQRVG